ncbi:MAG: MMPL family transporter, partial [Betaproteobacteria bacterium]|nr:MMPL family transporter [Betaproteobacteria bacterium]
SINQIRVTRFFQSVLAYPKTIIVAGLILILGSAIFIPTLQKDTRSDAFIPPDHPALIYRDKVEDIFGLKDPMVIAIVNEGETGIFNPQTLALVDWLTQQIESMDNIDHERVTSLATENDIIGTDDGMIVAAFFEAPPKDQQQADHIRAAVMDFPLYLGSLVSREGDATLIVAELIDQTQAQEVYTSLLELVERAPTQPGDAIHVAGEGAVSGYMGAYIDADAQRLNPIAALIITLILFVSFRTLRGTLLPNFVVLATVGSALGVMAAFDVRFFVITNALPVVLIGIAVADSIHILSQYYEEIAQNPKDTPQQIVMRTMEAMWRPITVTTFTTMAGFLGLSLASVMPPMQYFGLFAMLGVGVAWIFSITVLPAALSLLKLKPSPAYRTAAQLNAVQLSVSQVDRFGLAMKAFGSWVSRHHIVVLFLALLVTVAGVMGATRLELNEARIDIFQKDEPIVKADTLINQKLDGVHYLDVVVETPQAEDIFKPEHLRRIEALQRYAETLPNVNGSTSIVDYLKQMNRALNEDRLDAYQLPNDPDLVAQYFLLYSASGDPTDFEKEVDYDYRLANVRIRMDTGVYTDEKVVVEAMQHYVNDHFNTAGISANLSGRVNVDYHWIKLLGASHFGSVAVALILVWMMASFNMRSMVAGVITVIPVAFSVLLIYAVMGFSGIWLAIGTSMFAAIAIGLGVDFAVHTIERFKVLIREKQHSFDEAIEILYPSTGRALLFNFTALVLGFGVLATSEVVPLIKFGSLVAVGISASFIASMTLLPALIKAIQPAFLYPNETVASSVSHNKVMEANDLTNTTQKEKNDETQKEPV